MGLFWDLFLCGSVSAFEHTCTPELKLTQRQGTCGSELAVMLELSCILRDSDLMLFRKRNGPPSNKTTDMKVLKEQIMQHEQESEKDRVKDRETQDEVDLDKNTGQILTKESAMSFLNKRSDYYEQNVVCECCVFSCTVKEMREYC
uniref:Insulin-like peptide 3 n=1 Tax=Sinonovacula constricta TaxID=98310 RepID=A0A191TC54_SINCO|nr:insulin-like peptide 3 [Sinonovacula constricta]